MCQQAALHITKGTELCHVDKMHTTHMEKLSSFIIDFIEQSKPDKFNFKCLGTPDLLELT